MLTNLKDRITVFEISRTHFQAGCYTETLITKGEYWVNVQRVSQINAYVNGKDQQYNTYNITARYETGINNTHTIKWNNKELKIVASSDPTNRGKFLKIIAEEELI